MKTLHAIITVALCILCSILLVDRNNTESRTQTEFVWHSDPDYKLEVGTHIIIEEIKGNIVHLVPIEESNNVQDNKIQFVWNDDEESIPTDGSLVKIEMTDKNTVYLTPNE